MIRDKSRTAFRRANTVLVGGVDSPVRAFNAVGGEPPFIAKASGATITDIDGNDYIDYVCSYGPMILGHAHEQVTTAINKAVRKGTSYGAPTELEIELAQRIVSAVPSMEKVRFVSSGTEAAMSAIRLARGATGRDKIVKCVGCYHGHCDAMLVQAGSGALTLGVPSSPGVPAGATQDTLLVPYNDANAVAAMFQKYPSEIAGVIVEPVAANMGLVPPAEGYLAALRTVCDDNDALLIFDEVITGFRLAYGGAQEAFGVTPDLTVLGKIIGGGLPVGAYGGSERIMAHLAPEGPVYQAGTLSGNPAAMAAGIATLDVLREGLATPETNPYTLLQTRTTQLANGLRASRDAAGLSEKVQIVQAASMITCFFSHCPTITNYEDATTSNAEAFKIFFHSMLDAGVYLAPSGYEAMFVSLAHDAQAIQATVHAAEHAFVAAAPFA